MGSHDFGSNREDDWAAIGQTDRLATNKQAGPNLLVKEQQQPKNEKQWLA
jgi:hypothetical protein